MDCQDGAGAAAGAGEDRSKQVTDLREQILQLAGYACHKEEEKSWAELLEKLNICKRNTLVELCRSFDIIGSRANRKEELVSFLMKFLLLKDHSSGIDGTNPDKVTDLREQILQLAGHACHEEEEKSRAELVDKLNISKRDTLIELCRSFDIIGSRVNRKEELVSILMKFAKDHSSGIDGTNPDKKIKKRRRVKEETNFSIGKPLKKKKREGTALETQGEEEADGRKGREDIKKYCDLKDNGYMCADNKKGKSPNEEANLEPSEMINGSMSENLDAVALSEAQIPTNEHVLITTPSAKLVTTADGYSTDVKASKKLKSSITKKKTTPNEDRKVKSCGKSGPRGDAKPRNKVMKPSREELREAVFLILDTVDFATMTFGDVVKKVDKYFGKDLFERKPLIRCLIEEELFRLSEEAEKKELEEEEAAEAKATAEQAAKEMAQVRTVESGIDKRNELQAGQDGKTKDSAVNATGNTNEKGVNCEASADNRTSSDAAVQGFRNAKADSDTKNGDSVTESTKDGKDEKVAPIVNGGDAVQGSRNSKTEIMKISIVDTLVDSKDGKTKEASNGEYDATEDGRIGNGGNNAEDVNGCEAEDGKTEEANKTENSANVVIHGEKDGKAKEGDINTKQSPTAAGGDGKAEDAEHNANTKVDVDSSKNGAAENGKTGDDVKANSDGVTERSQM